MAAGIFFFDRFLPYYSPWLVLYSLCPLLLLLIVSGILKYKKPVYSKLFGLVAALCFFLIGGTLVLNERNRVDMTWSRDKCLYCGRVESSPESRGKTLCSVVNITGCINIEDSTVTPIRRNILLYWPDDSALSKTECGDEVLFYSRISKPLSDAEFMGFDYQRYLFTKGISGTAFVWPSDVIFRKTENPSIKSMALRCRDYIVNIYHEWEMDDEAKAVVSALTVGDKSELSAEVKSVYSAAGAGHVLALSGLHVGILSAMLYVLLWPLKRLRNGDLLQSLVVVAVLWAFAFMSGLSPSVVRAVTMCSLYLVASLFTENGLSGVYSLTIAAFAMLVYNPLYLFDVSFRLSFAAVASIILFFPYINTLFSIRNSVLKRLWTMLSVSISAQLGTTPLVLYYFGSFPTYFLVSNLIVVPLAACILCFTLASLLLWCVPYAGAFCIYALEVSASLLNASMNYISGLQGSQMKYLYASELQMLLLFVALCFLYRFIRYKRPFSVIIILMCLCTVTVIGLHRLLNRDMPSLYLAWSGVYLKNGREKTLLSSHNGVYSVNSVNIGVMNSSFWRNKELKSGEKPVTLDYAYFCRGFKGDLKSLSKLFCIKNIVFDSSFAGYYRNRIMRQCEEQNIPYYEISNQTSYKIILRMDKK